ncbi:MAG: DNA repair protein RecO [Alloprevotella sp.]|nr:DNA repair protein RecO [Alloprevotella sp.]
MLLSSKAIVLHTLRYTDGKLIVDMLTQEAGRQSFLLHRSKTRRSSAPSVNMFQPLSMVEIEWNYREQKQLQQLRSAHATPLKSIPYDIRKTSVALFLAEVLSGALRGEPITPQLFDFLQNSVLWLDEASVGTENFHITFLRRLIPFLGFEPNVEDYVEGSYFDLLNGVFTPTEPRHEHFLRPQEALLLPNLLRMNFGNLHLFAFTSAERARLLDFMVAYYRLHLPQFNEPKSLQVLHDIFRA